MSKLLYRLLEGLVEITLKRRKNPDNIQLPMVTELVKPLGLAVEAKLGQGGYGGVYRLSDGSVIKITEDEVEQDTAYQILVRDIRSEFLPRVYGVGSFPKTLKDNFYGVGFIIREELEPLSDSHKNILDLLLTVSDRWPIGVEELEKLLKRANYPTYKIHDAITYVYPVLETLWSELSPYGIRFAYMHKHNLGRRADGQLVIMDLGAIVFEEGGY